MAGSRSVLVLISADSRTSGRAFEAMRIALGVAAGENDVTIVLTGPAVHLLDADTDELVDGDDIAKFRESLRKLGIPFHVEGSALPADAADWNVEGHAVVPVSADALAGLLAKAERFIVF